MIEALDAEIRSEADRLLASGLQDALTSFGHFDIIGSYAHRLMAWRDLDIEYLKVEMNRREFFELGHRVAECLAPVRMEYRDELLGTTPGLPSGLYWGIYLGDERRGAWKIDIWWVDPKSAANRAAYDERLRARLTPETRRTIFEIKAAVWMDPGYRRSFSSHDIYEAVLTHGVQDLDSFRAYLRVAVGT